MHPLPGAKTSSNTYEKIELKILAQTSAFSAPVAGRTAAVPRAAIQPAGVVQGITNALLLQKTRIRLILGSQSNINRIIKTLCANLAV